MVVIDLNLGRNVLHHHNIYDALREIISNAFDAQVLSKSKKDIDINLNNNNRLEIINYGLSIKKENFIFNANNSNRNKHISKIFGYGLKDAICVLTKDDKHHLSIETNTQTFIAEYRKKQDVDQETLHIVINEKKRKEEKEYTKFTITNITPKNLEHIKTQFVKLFDKEPEILYEDNHDNKIYKLKDKHQHIFVNGVLVIENSGWYFSYDFVKDNTIMEATNRDRKTIDKSIFIKKIQSIWKTIKLFDNNNKHNENLFDYILKLLKAKSIYELNHKLIIKKLIININNTDEYIFIDKNDNIKSKSIKNKIEKSNREIIILGDSIRKKFKLNNKPIRNISELNNKQIFYGNNYTESDKKIFTLMEFNEPIIIVQGKIKEIINILKDKLKIDLDNEVEENLLNINIMDDKNDDNLDDDNDDNNYQTPDESENDESVNDDSEDDESQISKIINDKLKGDDYDFTGNPLQISNTLFENGHRLKCLIFNYIMHNIDEEEKIRILMELLQNKTKETSWFMSWFN
jgi:hypothetical protein